MINFENLKEQLKIKKYFLVKDYVLGANYIVDTSIANYLFGGYCDYLRSDCLFNEQYFHTRSFCLEKKELFEEQIPVFKDLSPYLDKKPYPALKQRIREMEREKNQNIDVQTREKTPEELRQGRTVRLIGAYRTLDKAKKDYKKVCAHNNKNGFCKPEERVIVEHTGTKIPTDFKGKVVTSPSFSI